MHVNRQMMSNREHARRQHQPQVTQEAKGLLDQRSASLKQSHKYFHSKYHAYMSEFRQQRVLDDDQQTSHSKRRWSKLKKSFDALPEDEKLHYVNAYRSSRSIAAGHADTFKACDAKIQQLKQ